eukprot:5815353-Prymnesium_polylepis.1
MFSGDRRKADAVTVALLNAGSAHADLQSDDVDAGLGLQQVEHRCATGAEAGGCLPQLKGQLK